MRKTFLFTALVLSIILTSCATIISGTTQKVSLSSNPSLANVYIDEIKVGKTPYVAKLERKTEHKVKIELAGYKPYETTLTRKFNAWYIGNVFIGGLIGLVVDAATGSIYNLSPNQVNAAMSNGITFKSNSKDVYIGVTLNVDKNWVEVAKLQCN